jgi:tetratricopeptide (TPR) repeat protein
MLIRAKRFQERGRTNNAMDLYNKVLERSPSNIDALSGLAYSYRDIHANGRAIATFRRVLGLQPSFGPALLGLAETFKNQGQKEQALKYYNRYLSTNPSGRYAGMAKRNVTLLSDEISESTTGQKEPEPAKKESITADGLEPTPTETQKPKADGQKENTPEEKVINSPVSSETP